MRKVWVVVANSGKAKIYRADNVHHLTEIHDLIHPEIHMRDQDLVSDKPGRDSSPMCFPHNMTQKTPQKVKEKDHFAVQVAHLLQKGIEDGECERIYLIAPSNFLGHLRDAFNVHISKIIEKEIIKDLTANKAEEIREYLPPVL
jgi:protein required for attachment to host cells